MKKAIITGASSGLGLEIGKILQNKNIEVINLSRKESPFTNIKCDLKNNDDLNKAIEIIKEKYADFDTLILNAGIIHQNEIGDIRESEIEDMFKINSFSTLNITNKLNKLITQNEADILITGSTASFRTIKPNIGYSASKHATKAIINGLQGEYSNENVRVIGFHPGGFNSNLWGKHIDGYMDSKELAKIATFLLETPRNIEISEIVINRNKGFK